MRDITLCHPRLQALAAELIRDYRLKLEKHSGRLRSRMPCTHRGDRSRVRSSRMQRAAAIAAIISGEWRLIFTEPMAAVPIMIKMDSFPRSARSEYLSAWNGVETGRVLRIDLTSSSRLGIINEWNQEDLQDPGAVHEDVAKGREKDHHSGLAT